MATKQGLVVDVARVLAFFLASVVFLGLDYLSHRFIKGFFQKKNRFIKGGLCFPVHGSKIAIENQFPKPSDLFEESSCT